MPVQILRHAILMVLRNATDALKASAGPILLGIALISLLLASLGLGPASMLSLTVSMGTGADSMPDLDPAVAGAASFGLLASMLVMLFAMSWVAVAWHRFILLEEYPGLLPSLSGQAVWRYLGRSIVLAFLVMLVVIPASVVIGLALGPVMASAPFIGSALTGVLLGLVFGYAWLRLALVLPAAAVGEDMTIAASWRATGAHSGTIWAVSALLIGLNFVLGLFSLPFGSSFVAVIVDLAVTWFTLMVGLSVLTTLYGHIVQKRSLAD